MCLTKRIELAQGGSVTDDASQSSLQNILIVFSFGFNPNLYCTVLIIFLYSALIKKYFNVTFNECPFVCNKSTQIVLDVFWKLHAPLNTTFVL